ncbi:MAG: extracellular solute-binding protein [Phycisphaerales bacterium]|nr:MAG: extracellular solute-binding protein [Phycisphaerales bacterium]
MCTRYVFVGSCVSLAVLAFASLGAPSATAQEVLRVYGSEGPAPAIQQAAGAFGDRNDVKVDVVTGPPDEWLDGAAGTADVVFASAEFMMADFLRATNLAIDEVSVTPLYMRPSAVLVRPKNPKHISDFPDLLKPGVRIMVVTGSGQTGLWEDMAGKQGDIRTIRAFRKNIALFAPNSTAAMRLWDERQDVDAFVTWNIWHMPLRDRAQLIEVSDDYKIYRQCSIALTERGVNKPSARRFIDFLTSPEGARIFESWYWMPVPKGSSALTINNDIAIVCRIDTDDWKDGLGAGLTFVRGLVGSYRSIGTPAEQLHISAVVHGGAGYWMLKDASYGRSKRSEAANPNKTIIRELGELGVSLELCEETMKEHGWTAEDLLPGVRIVPNAYARIVDLELQGYAYIRF